MPISRARRTAARACWSRRALCHHPRSPPVCAARSRSFAATSPSAWGLDRDGRSPHDQLGTKEHLLLVVLARPARQQTDCRRADATRRLADRAQGHDRRSSEIDVVVPDDGDVVGYTHDAVHHEPLQEPERDEVIRGEDPVRPSRWIPPGDPPGGETPLLDSECGSADELERGIGNPCHGLLRTIEPIGHLAQRRRPTDQTQAAPTDRPGSSGRDQDMPRVCFELRVRPELLDEHVARHRAVWPEMLAEIAAAGRRNYSLFLADGGRLVGYYEVDDDAAAQAYLAASPIAAKWEAEMARFFDDLKGRPDQTATPLTELFHLADQLAAASPNDESDAS